MTPKFILSQLKESANALRLNKMSVTDQERSELVNIIGTLVVVRDQWHDYQQREKQNGV